MPDPKLLWFHSTERKSVYVEGEGRTLIFQPFSPISG